MPDLPDPDIEIGTSFEKVNPRDWRSAAWVFVLRMRYAEQGHALKEQRDVRTFLTNAEAAEFHDLCCRIAERALREDPH